MIINLTPILIELPMNITTVSQLMAVLILSLQIMVWPLEKMEALLIFQ